MNGHGQYVRIFLAQVEKLLYKGVAAIVFSAFDESGERCAIKASHKLEDVDQDYIEKVLAINVDLEPLCPSYPAEISSAPPRDEIHFSRPRVPRWEMVFE